MSPAPASASAASSSGLHSRKLRRKPKKGPVMTTVLRNGDYMGVHVSLGECRVLGVCPSLLLLLHCLTGTAGSAATDTGTATATATGTSAPTRVKRQRRSPYNGLVACVGEKLKNSSHLCSLESLPGPSNVFVLGILCCSVVRII